MDKKPLFVRMTEDFQCPGCVVGGDTDCGKYRKDENTNCCESHVLGTFVYPGGPMALGLPKGFCRPGSGNKMPVRFHEKTPVWNELNVPVWFLHEGGFTFVRTYLPRVNIGFTDVIEGEIAVPSPAVNIRPLMDRMD